ncbi:glutamate--tRNA ligase [Candidatus Daviesbacteria bacterium]|nr:glutamate--tRNA ligase [Candidatus Daviesbacteria bacterium]
MVRVRMAPSPTGKLHLGSAHTALFNYCFAKHQAGKFILRIEDTDRERSTQEYTTDIIRALEWLGLLWDEGPIFQMQRLEIYKKYADVLLEKKLAYWCFCTPEELAAERKLQQAKHESPKYGGTCRNLTAAEQDQFAKAGRKKAVRFIVSGEKIAFDDLVRGKIEFDTSLFGDFIILKSDGVPTYNFAVVVDDRDMQISHVIRGEDHISNTPRQLLLLQALGFEVPKYAHLSNILNPSRLGKLSKRFGATGVSDFQADGYLAEAVINYLAILGWSHPQEQDFFDLQELVGLFDLDRVDAAAAAFDIEKLNWYNGQYIRKLSCDQLLERLKPFLLEYHDLPQVKSIIPLVQERMTTLKDFIPLAGFFFTADVELAESNLVQKNKTRDDTGQFLAGVAKLLGEISDWSEQVLEEALRSYTQDKNWTTGEAFMTIRVAVTGQKATPPLFATMQALGKDKVLTRINQAIQKLT